MGAPPGCRESRPGRGWLAGPLVAAALVAVLAGCVPAAVPTGPPPAAAPAPAPAEVAQTAAALEAAYRQAGFGLVRARQAYVPAEPLGLESAPRTVYQVVLPADPGAGFVVVYEAPDTNTANTWAAELRDYLQSGFGQTNYPTDAQFAISIYGPTVVFGWYSPGASADASTAGRALDVLRAFGQPVPVVR